jgi:major membrane immunogen (membrane-anchored lipoprotein)
MGQAAMQAKSLAGACTTVGAVGKRAAWNWQDDDDGVRVAEMTTIVVTGAESMQRDYQTAVWALLPEAQKQRIRMLRRGK